MAVVPARRMRLTEHVAEKILELIRTRHLTGGDRLPTETELMELMQVGRSSVREAIRGLAVMGIVEIRQGQGTFVKAPVVAATGKTDGTMGEDALVNALARGITEELLEARQVIEVRIASLAAQRVTAEDLTDLERLIADARHAADAGRTGQAFRLGAEFHLGVARAAHNNVLEGFVASYVHLMIERGVTFERLPGYLDWEIRAHDGIRQAIAARDARLAASRMRDHLTDMSIHFAHLGETGARTFAPVRHLRR